MSLVDSIPPVWQDLQAWNLIIVWYAHLQVKEADYFRRESESAESKLKELNASLINLKEGMEQLSQENEVLMETKAEMEQKIKSLHWKW